MLLHKIIYKSVFLFKIKSSSFNFSNDMILTQPIQVFLLVVTGFISFTVVDPGFLERGFKFINYSWGVSIAEFITFFLNIP